MVADQLNTGLKQTLQAAQAQSTRKTYTRIEDLLQQFETTTGLQAFPADVRTTALFAQYLSRSYKPSTIRTYFSALSYKYKMQNVWDPTTAFLVKQALLGIWNLNPSVDSRLPITLPILSRLIKSVTHATSTTYQGFLFETMFIVAFFGLFRIGELAHTPAGHAIQRNDVIDDQQQQQIIIHMSSFKHSKRGQIHKVILQHHHPGPCPVHALLAYISMRPSSSHTQLFLHANGSPVSYKDFCTVLNSCCTNLGLPQHKIQSHSFRIGGATYFSSLGYSDSQIRSLGRWNSNAFKKYIRQL